MKIAIAGDHGGFLLKNELIKHLQELKIPYIDCGTDSQESCDYPDYAEKACKLVLSGEVTYAVLICGTGIGMSITANKINGIRAALCSDEFSRVIGPGLAVSILDAFINSKFEGGRHERRLEKIRQIERSHNHV